MREMRPIADEIGLPDLSEEQIEILAEACEARVTDYILDKIPKKSIEELSVSCTLQLGEQLDVDIDIDLSQKYEVGSDLDDLLSEAAEYGTAWLENRLRELKGSES
ncbi:DUF3194 domain-containing protein [Candidatus Thorarchaeota archaeon]|nr:MAG: DUF3194 domain-containing protein [Candidatus Thorarchaeota archaeon]